MSRTLCDLCGLHTRLCVCDACRPVANETAITILQHPSEVGRAKGTVRVLAQCLQSCRICIGESPVELARGGVDTDSLGSGVGLLFPGPDSRPLESAPPSDINHWIVLDGTWRKAAKLVHLNPVLQALPSYHLVAPPPSRYIIRKAPGPGYLATAEAVAHLLATMEPGLDTTPIDYAMKVLVQRLLAQVPASLRHRYGSREGG
ncbi:tRNA-uridine aminocarboxypropyltransferase [Marinobacter xestospongiae]|uniref:tRNA-uridine aminocarboxypropyltransferase n=1 Tax=Marinobacter xestospongiae TaxID=994319 RepID=UPI002006D62A|nr:tRNA-uridine aminocarboxypropyltransferase [Marinobacter xestospongiae]MCK7565595.1 DTW domain-containing protein [Marinobacter xestospongiae]